MELPYGRVPAGSTDPVCPNGCAWGGSEPVESQHQRALREKYPLIPICTSSGYCLQGELPAARLPTSPEKEGVVIEDPYEGPGTALFPTTEENEAKGPWDDGQPRQTIIDPPVEGSAESIELARVPYGSTDLSRAVQKARLKAKDREGNYAAGRLKNGKIVIGRSNEELHAEEEVIEKAGQKRIVEIYSEREPCTNKCEELTKEMNPSWSWDWNGEGDREATKKEMPPAIRAIFEKKE